MTYCQWIKPSAMFHLPRFVGRPEFKLPLRNVYKSPVGMTNGAIEQGLKKDGKMSAEESWPGS